MERERQIEDELERMGMGQGGQKGHGGSGRDGIPKPSPPPHQSHYHHHPGSTSRLEPGQNLPPKHVDGREGAWSQPAQVRRSKCASEDRMPLEMPLEDRRASLVGRSVTDRYGRSTARKMQHYQRPVWQKLFDARIFDAARPPPPPTSWPPPDTLVAGIAAAAAPASVSAGGSLSRLPSQTHLSPKSQALNPNPWC